jgi:hypothetical protein
MRRAEFATQRDELTVRHFANAMKRMGVRIKQLEAALAERDVNIVRQREYIGELERRAKAVSSCALCPRISVADQFLTRRLIEARTAKDAPGSGRAAS